MNSTPESQEDILPKSRCQPLFVTVAAVIASVGGVLFGYDIGITSGALLQLKQEFHLSSFEQEMVVSSVLIGAFLASFFGGIIVDSWGRKAGMIISCFLFIIGAFILSFSINFIMIIIGRIIVGVAVCLSVTAECTYISEISPPAHRGMMVSLNEIGITSGFLLAYLINYLFIQMHQGWKYMFGIAAIPAVLQAIGICAMPNSHHYLLYKGQMEKARIVLRKLRNQSNVEDEMKSIISAMQEQKSYKYTDLFTSTSNMRHRMFLGMMLVLLQQFSGNANVLYYAPTVFQYFGFNSDTVATLVTIGLGIIKVLSTTVTLLIVDKVGRRSLLLVGCIFMAISIILLGIVGIVTDSNTTNNDIYSTTNHSLFPTQSNATDIEFNLTSVIENTDATHQLQNGSKLFEADSFKAIEQSAENVTMNSIIGLRTGTPAEMYAKKKLDNEEIYHANINYNETGARNSSIKSDDHNISLFTKLTSVISLMVFVCAYGISYGPVTWLVLSEIFPGSLRGRAISVATCINWGSNIIVSATFLDILNAIGIGPTFVIYGFISVGAAIFVFFCVPETKSKSLEEINAVLSKS